MTLQPPCIRLRSMDIYPGAFTVGDRVSFPGYLDAGEFTVTEVGDKFVDLARDLRTVENG